MKQRKRQRGSAMLEFVLAGIASITMVISIVQLGLVMWNYHTLAYAVHETNRYIASHGRNCTTFGNSCGITVGDVATKLKTYAVGIPDTNMSMTLTTQSGTSYPCTTVSSCESAGDQWPPSAHMDNAPGSYTKITAKTTLNLGIIVLWFGTSGIRISSVTLPATSNIPMVF